MYVVVVSFSLLTQGRDPLFRTLAGLLTPVDERLRQHSVDVFFCYFVAVTSVDDA